MAINRMPIKVVDLSDIGRPVSVQNTGMVPVRHGVIAGVSRLPEYVFVRIDDDENAKLVLRYNCRWGEQAGWLKTEMVDGLATTVEVADNG